MPSQPLDNLVRTGQLKREEAAETEFLGLLRSGLTRLKDAANETLSAESRFDLLYNAAHSLSLAALRWHGYRPANRYIVFQALSQTIGLPSQQWRVLDKAHNMRNRVEYEGTSEVDEEFVSSMLRVTTEVAARVQKLRR